MAGIQKSFVDIKDPLIVADLGSETVGGGSNTVCALGNGRLTAGISPWGETVYFRWPSPSHYDHLRYLTEHKPLIHGLMKISDVRYGSDAPCADWFKYGRPYEKYPGLGACGGLHIKDKGTIWQDQPLWNSSRNYRPEWSHLLETTLKGNENLTGTSAEMHIEQWVMPSEDLMVQHYTVNAPDADAFFYHSVFAPWMTNPSSFTNPDSAKAGFAAFYCEQAEIIMWAFPGAGDRKNFRQNLAYIRTPEDAGRLCSEDGIFIAMGCSDPLDGFQVGADIKGRFRFGSHPPAGRDDAEDGELQNNRFYAGSSDGAVKISLSDNKTEVTVFIGISGSPEKAAALVTEAGSTGTSALKQKALAQWKTTVDRIHVPALASDTGKTASRRSILNLLLGKDKNTGAIIASPTRQPCYSCDWPRDGAFYDLALDLAGLHKDVYEHLLFYRNTQRKEPVAFNKTRLASFRLPVYRPRGHWYANMNCDGTPGFFKIIPFEIDETSLIVWDIWRHSLYLNEAQNENYQQTFKETLLLAMAAIMSCIDLKKGRTKKVMEDDHYIAKSTFHGWASVLTALASAADLADKWGLDPELREKWHSAALILRKNMLSRVKEAAENPAVAGWRGIQWSLFPSPLFDDNTRELSDLFLEVLAEDMHRKGVKREGGVGYLGEKLFTSAVSSQHTSKYNELQKEVLDVLLKDAVVEGTGCYGELGLWLDFDDKKIIQNRTSIPHLWSGITAFLSVFALNQPEAFYKLRPPL